MSHLGRPKNGPENKYSLKHLISHLEKLTGAYIEFSNDCVSSNAIRKSKNLAHNTIHLLENLRFHYQETQGDKSFAEKLAQHGDIYVNDAFGTAHRAHASTSIVAQYFENKCFGYLMAKEVANAKKLMSNPERPFTSIVGGAKVSDKILIIENLLNIADHIIIGGGMAYTFSVAQGGTIGDSLFEADRVEKCAEILEKAAAKGVQIHLPADNVCADAFSNDANQQLCASGTIPDGWMGLDIGEKAIAAFSDVLLKSKTILWNGPMGVFEMPSYEKGTKAVAQAVADATKAGAFSLIGGGDSSAAVKKFGFTDDVSYVSTGGGALLEFFEGKELTGIIAVES
jgi:phosphoglycerate kinase